MLIQLHQARHGCLLTTLNACCCVVQSPYKEQVGTMMLTYVLPCFDSAYGHVRAKACWVAGTYADTDFDDGKGLGMNFTRLFEKVGSCFIRFQHINIMADSCGNRHLTVASDKEKHWADGMTLEWHVDHLEHVY